MNLIKAVLSSLLLIIIFLFNTNLIDNDVIIDKIIENKIDYKEMITNLKEEYNNQDIVGILKLDSNNLVIPILQSTNNEYYLNHSITKEDSYIGSVFLDYRVNINTSNKLLIYGHSSSKDDTYFNVLENYYEEKYYKKNKYINFITDNEERIYEIFSVYIDTSDFSYMNINFIDSSDYLNHIKYLKSKSLYDTNVELSEDDEILILQTCSNHDYYKNYEKKYLLIISRRIK